MENVVDKDRKKENWVLGVKMFEICLEKLRQGRPPNRAQPRLIRRHLSI